MYRLYSWIQTAVTPLLCSNDYVLVVNIMLAISWQKRIFIFSVLFPFIHINIDSFK